MLIRGHYWTLAPAIKFAIFPPSSCETRSWSYPIEDSSGHEVTLSGQWRENTGAKTLGVVIHGLGGNPTSASVLQIANAMEQRGWSTLRYAMRGSENGLDFYHSGLSRDVILALSDPRFAHYEEIFIVGLSLGGHITMRLAANDTLDDRVVALAAVCAPLDLDACARFIDKPSAYIYRNYVLGGLREHYELVAKQGGPAPISLERMRQIRTIQEWDALVTVQRFGFDDVTHYYASQAAMHLLDKIERPPPRCKIRWCPPRPRWSRSSLLRKLWTCGGSPGEDTSTSPRSWIWASLASSAPSPPRSSAGSNPDDRARVSYNSSPAITTLASTPLIHPSLEGTLDAKAPHWLAPPAPADDLVCVWPG